MSIQQSLRLAVVALVNMGGLGFAQTIHITGTVVDSLSSQGIGGATVKVLEYPSVSATTSASGAFSLAGTNVFRQRLPGNTSRGIILRSDRVMFKREISSGLVSVDLFTSKGSRVFTPVHFNPTYLFIRRDLDPRRDPWVDPHQSSSKGALAKVSAAYTLQVTATGYLTKNVTLGILDTSVGAIRLMQEKESTGVWKNVTPPEMANDESGFGAGSIAGDPLRPSDMYVGGSESGIWKSTDYGKTWRKINDLSPDITRGCIIAVAPTTPATIYVAGFGEIFKSTNAGVSFDTLSTGGFDPYSFAIDPYDPNHLLSGLHEAADVIESTNGGVSWKKVGSGSIGGGVSVYPFFIDMGNAAATRTTWFAIAQNGSSPGRTTNGGASWSMPAGLSGLEHPHGNARIFQQGPNLWVGGAYDFRGTIMRSTDYGVTWSKVTTNEKPEAVVWGTEKKVYAMYAWACSKCDVPTNFAHAPLPGGNTWTYEDTPSLKIGPNSMAVANNGTHNVFVGLMWAEGLWRYVEP